MNKLGIGYDMGIYPIPIPKKPNSYGYLPNTHTIPKYPIFLGIYSILILKIPKNIEYLGMGNLFKNRELDSFELVLQILLKQLQILEYFA
jgi:hypothetical protein